jgi:hypothetical protein
MTANTTIRLHRHGVSYDLEKTGVRRVCACTDVIALGDRGAFTAIIDGVPVLLIEPAALRSAMASASVASASAATNDSVLLPRFAVLIGESADMPLAIAADQLDTWADPMRADARITTQAIHDIVLSFT